MKKLFAVVTILLSLTGAGSLPAQSGLVTSTVVQPKPVNLDFEAGAAGKLPDGWVSPTDGRGFQAELTEVSPQSGRRTALLKSLPEATHDARAFGNLMQAIDAAPYRGRRVRLRAAVRLESEQRGTRANLWLRADRPNKQPGFFDNMSDRSIFTGSWQFFEIVGDIEEDASVLNFGVLLQGRGAVYLDTVTLEDLGAPTILAEPPRALTAQGLENLIAFARLLGYVRHFHPSDEAAATDWEAFAVEGIRLVETAKNKKELTAALDKLFRPVAPTVRVYRSGKRVAQPKELKPKKTDGLKIIYWHHVGFGQKNAGQSAYSSERKALEIPAEKTPAPSPDPSRPFVADLGGGVSASVPFALFVGDKGTLPGVTKAAENAAAGKTLLYKFSGNDRLTRLTSVILAWNVFQHFYPYFDQVQTDWNQVLKDSLTTAAADKDEKEFLRTLERMVARLYDGHGNVVHKSQFNTRALPVDFAWAEDHLVIAQAGKNAEELQPGDIVLSIDGKLSAEVLAEAESLVSGATAQWRRHIALGDLRMGALDSEARLEVRNESGQTHIVTLRRGNATGIEDTRRTKIEEVKPNVFYVDLNRISDDDFRAALPKLEKATGIIFDLRGYPKVSTEVLSHLIDKPVQSAQWLIPIVSVPDHRNMTNYDRRGRWDLQPKQPRLAAKIAFLTDGRAISYAESYMGIIEAYKLAEIVGEPTAGTNGNINPFTVPGGYRIIWTGMRVIKHDDSPHHGIGIKPTVPVSRTIKGIREKRDEQLERAIEVVSR
ncbi:MAG: S41 family peptidase [Acidobacteriota bacterium]|nr:S41 family peptidase [Acidobacteriota bacterium]